VKKPKKDSARAKKALEIIEAVSTKEPAEIAEGNQCAMEIS